MYYYHGLGGNVVTYDLKTILEISIKQLETILKSGGLYSKRIMDKNNIYNTAKPVLNGEDYISVCVKDFDKSEYGDLLNIVDSAYNKYIINRISFVIDSKIGSELEFRQGSYEKLPGERQVKNFIDIKYFKAIFINLESLELTNVLKDVISQLLDKYNIELPIITNINELNNEHKR